MAYQLGNNKAKRSTRKVINLNQKNFPLGYVSTIDNSRRPQTSVSDATNMELTQDNVWRPRPPLVRYGTQPPFPIVGRGKYRFNGVRGLIWMLNVSGVGQIFRQVDGGAFVSVGGSYDITGWTGFAQSKGKLYPFNGINNLSYVDMNDWSIKTYTSLPTPSAPTVAVSANLASSPSLTYYYRVAANNAVGTSIASTVSLVANVNTARSPSSTQSGSGGWSAATSVAKTVTVSWSAVTGATSYTLYVGDSPLTLNELITVTGTSYVDDGSLTENPFVLAPEGDSSKGFIPTWLYNDPKNSQIFGIDPNNKLYYSAAGTNDFSPYNGGGWVTIDESGDTVLNFVDGFRDGSGKPVITTSSRGAAGAGLLNHVTFEQLTIGDQIINYPNVYPASGQSGTYAPRATIKENNGLFYPTGLDFKSTTTSQNILNILTTDTISLVINDNDVPKINLAALKNAVGVAYKQRLYFALPVNSNTNNEIWYIDLARKNAWILRWTVPATDLWLYEDSLGLTHFCALVKGVILEFTRAGAQPHQDDGVAFSSRLAFESLEWDQAGIALGTIQHQYAKLLNPQGTINFNATGLTRTGVSQSLGNSSFSITTTYTGYDLRMYDDDLLYDADPGTINSYGKSVTVLPLRPKGLLIQENWEILANTAGTDYILSTVVTRGWYDENLIAKL